MEIIPIWKSVYSVGKSILTLDEAGNYDEKRPVSIFDLCKNANIKNVVLIDETFSGFLQAYSSAQKAELNLIFGINFTFCNDVNDKSESSLQNEHKINILAKNTNGYKKLIKIYSEAASKYKYYVPRLDFKVLKGMWDENLLLCIPFYDSFLFNNVLTLAQIVPDFPIQNKNITFFLEDKNLPFDDIIREKTTRYCKNNDFNFQETHSIYYNKNEDFKAYLTFRCVGSGEGQRKTLSKPNFEHMCSNWFSFEKYLEKVKNNENKK